VRESSALFLPDFRAALTAAIEVSFLGGKKK